MRVETRTTPAYWQKETGTFRPFTVTGNPFAAMLAKYLPVDSRMSCVEVGAYPGGNLLYLARRFGYRPSAIEYRDDAADIQRLFEFNGIEAPEIIQGDFLTLEPRQFDVVTSFGFVEHFDDPQAVIRKHVEFLKPGGYLVISVPHFWGMQGFFRTMVLSREALNELHATHNMDIMHLKSLRQVLRSLGLAPLFLGHVMNGRFWIDKDSPKVRHDRRWLVRALGSFDRHVGAKLPSCVLFSPMVLAICKKAG